MAGITALPANTAICGCAFCGKSSCANQSPMRLAHFPALSHDTLAAANLIGDWLAQDDLPQNAQPQIAVSYDVVKKGSRMTNTAAYQ
jgi:hypothetical protein